MNYHTRYSAITSPIVTCLTGGGAFGQSYLGQARRIKTLEARIAVDLSTDAAARALASAGWDRADIALCDTPGEAKIAYARGQAIAAALLETVIDLPFALLVEATGHPEAAAKHAVMAIETRRHVMLVTKETDSVAGPMLARMAQDHGVGITPVDGDQPSLLIDLVTWAETLGFDILGAGKSSEYDFVFDKASGHVTSNGVRVPMAALAGLWASDARPIKAVTAARADLLRPHFLLKAVPDLCEMTLVANQTGLGPDIAPFHAPVARIPEVASLFDVGGEDALFSAGRRLDVFHHLRASDEASFAGGVFVTVRCHDKTSWQVLADKGHAVSSSGRSAMIYLPRHLLGLEAATSILDLAGLGQSAYTRDYAPRMDLIAVATQNIPAGTVLNAVGHHHTIADVTAEMRPATPVSEDKAMPYYLVANRILAKSVTAGSPIRLSDLEMNASSTLFSLRQMQDRTFL